jgi:uncharacterized membrane protein
MGIGMIVLLVTVVLLVVYLVRSTNNQQTHPPAYYAASPAQQTGERRAPESPRDIVQRRYAGGEIDREEYLQKLKDL